MDGHKKSSRTSSLVCLSIRSGHSGSSNVIQRIRNMNTPFTSARGALTVLHLSFLSKNSLNKTQSVVFYSSTSISCFASGRSYYQNLFTGGAQGNTIKTAEFTATQVADMIKWSSATGAERRYYDYQGNEVTADHPEILTLDHLTQLKEIIDRKAATMGEEYRIIIFFINMEYHI